jgi:hypothetical protein
MACEQAMRLDIQLNIASAQQARLNYIELSASFPDPIIDVQNPEGTLLVLTSYLHPLSTNLSNGTEGHRSMHGTYDGILPLVEDVHSRSLHVGLPLYWRRSYGAFAFVDVPPSHRCQAPLFFFCLL